MSDHTLNARYGRKIGLLKLIKAQMILFFGGYRRYQNIHWQAVHRLVFICKGNICRSAYADVRANLLGLNAVSAGLRAAKGVKANHDVIRMAAARNTSLESHRTTNISDFQRQAGDLFLCMEPSQARYISNNIGYSSKIQVTLLGLWSKKNRPFLQDPYGLQDQYWDTCLDIIDSAIIQISMKISQCRAEASSDAES